HDWGGMIGLVHAISNPGRVRRLVIMNTSGFLPPYGKRIPLRLRLIRDLAPFATPAVLGLNLFARAALYMATGKGLSPEVKSGLIAPYNSWKNRIATLKFVQDIPLAPKDPGYVLVKKVDDNLHALSATPILICWGERDFVFDTAYLAEFRRRLPGAEVHSFPDAGHYVLEDKSEQIRELVKKFLNENPIQTS
ncbi:MAG: alpha/beta hydrolase, partial [Desulfobacterales bacterium]|nr:alpha/beta hydrolase [Desulfobacterales bacterium]